MENDMLSMNHTSKRENINYDFLAYAPFLTSCDNKLTIIIYHTILVKTLT